jgi:molybdate transport system substrate-binding protein
MRTINMFYDKITTNALVLIGPAGSDASGSEVLPLLGAQGRLAMGQRDAVPAGIYAREWLQSTGQWDGLKHRLAETDNVRAALALVARGQTPVGVVYASDAVADKTVQVLAEIPGETHSAITYPAAALTPAGQAFLGHLTTSEAQAIFATHGFGLVPE